MSIYLEFHTRDSSEGFFSENEVDELRPRDVFDYIFGSSSDG